MEGFRMRKFTRTAAFLFSAAAAVMAMPGLPARAADHGDAPNVAGDQAADLADTFVFLDPADATKVIIAMNFRGFIVPGEGVNFSVFDSRALYRFEIENTGDSKPDSFIDVTFSPKETSGATAQVASVKLPGSKKVSFTAPTTPSTLAATPNAPTITTDPVSGVTFFAGAIDDPFVFDLVAFNRFVASVVAGSADPTLLTRGRDTFAGYNILNITLSVPVGLVRGKDATNNIVGVNSTTQRRTESVGKNGLLKASGKFRQMDRAATPAVNVALIPYARKNEFNASTTIDDAKGKFADSIVATLKALGTSDANIAVLAGVAVTNGDFVRVNLTMANTGPGGGNNAGAGFPNGRRPGDDVIDTLLTIITNGTITSDGATGNDATFRDTFPFFAPPHQPLGNGEVDGTQN
jgi:hypothetical protein